MKTNNHYKSLTPCPPQGSGVHRWIFATACELRRRGEEDSGIEHYLATHCTRNNLREIREAVRNSGGSAIRTLSPPRSPARVRRFHLEEMTLADLFHNSPYYFSGENGAIEVLPFLFGEDALLCIGLTRTLYRVGTIRELGGLLARAEFIVPNEACSRFGHTQSGKWSRRCLEMFPRRTYVVIECDPPPPATEEERQLLLDRQASLLWFLAHKAPLVMVVDSGGKSLHGWFLAHPEESVNQRFIAYASELGADPASKNRCQLYRMPQGTRATGQLHFIHYFNPEALS